MTLQQSHDLIYQICTDAEFAFTDSNLRKFVDDNVVQHWLQVAPKRQALYQQLVFANALDVIGYVFKATQQCLSAAAGWEKNSEQAFEFDPKVLALCMAVHGDLALTGEGHIQQIFKTWVADFLRSNGITTRFYHQIPLQFWQWLKQKPEFVALQSEALSAVADFEITRWQLYQNPSVDLPPAASMDLPLSQVRLHFTTGVVCRSYAWPVHRFANDLQFMHLQTKTETNLLLYRHLESQAVEVCEWIPSALAFVEWALKNSPNSSVEELILEFTNVNPASNMTASDVLVYLQNILKLNIAMIVE